MGRLLFFVVLGLAIYIGWRWMRITQSNRARPGASTPPAPTTPEAMVRCAHCGVHLPRSEAITSGGQLYCCEEHRQFGPRA